MSWKDVIKDPAEEEVFLALEGPSITWRTTSAIARQIGLPEQRVADILRKYHSKLTRIYEGPTLTGQPLVGLIERVG